jgi:hypothetical protein
MNDSLNTLMVSAIEDNWQISSLLWLKSRRLYKIKALMEQKARNKTPLDERQRQSFHEFMMLYAQEGGNLKETLMGLNHALSNDIDLHNENSEALLKSLTALHGLQRNAIHSLRRLIASSDNILIS